MFWRGLAIAISLAASMPLSARADPAPRLGWDTPRPAALHPAPASSATTRAHTDATLASAWMSQDDLHQVLQGGSLAAHLPATASGIDQDRKVKSLPAPPGSASLFLYAVGTLGALQISRSARRLQLAETPVWLHMGGPDQIGRAVRFDPFSMMQPLPGLFTLQIPLHPLLPRTSRLNPPIRWRSQGASCSTAPRGPPQASPPTGSTSSPAGTASVS